MIFEHSEKTRALIDQVSRFMEEEVIPNAPLFNQQAAEGERYKRIPVLETLKAKARSRGLWNLFMPPHSGHSPVDESFEDD